MSAYPLRKLQELSLSVGDILVWDYRQVGTSTWWGGSVLLLSRIEHWNHGVEFVFIDLTMYSDTGFVGISLEDILCHDSDVRVIKIEAPVL